MGFSLWCQVGTWISLLGSATVIPSNIKLWFLEISLIHSSWHNACYTIGSQYSLLYYYIKQSVLLNGNKDYLDIIAWDHSMHILCVYILKLLKKLKNVIKVQVR